MNAAATPQKVIARGVGSSALSFVIRFAARISLLWIGGRLFGKELYGVYAFAVATVEVAVPIASLGLKRMLFPWLEEEAQRRGAPHVLMDALLLAGGAGVLTALAVMAISWSLPHAAISDQQRLALIVLAPAVLCQITGDIALAATRWTHKMRFEVTGRGLVEPYVGTLVTFAAWYAGLQETGMLIGYWGGSLALAAYSLSAARRGLGPYRPLRWRPSRRALASRIRQLLPASGSDFVTALAGRIDLFMVGLLLGDGAAGIYGIVRQLRTPIMQVRQAFDGILTPLTARTMRADGDATAGEAMAAATRVILSAQLAVVLLMVAAGDTLLSLFGAQYVVGYATLLAMVATETVNGAFGVPELIIYYRQPHRALGVNLALILMAAALIPLAAPELGTLGAALAMLVAATIAALLRRYWLRGLGVRSAPLHAAPPVLAALAGGAVGLGAYEVLARVIGAPLIVDKIAPPLLAIGTYAALIWLWRKLRPGALSLARFRIS